MPAAIHAGPDRVDGQHPRGRWAGAEGSGSSQYANGPGTRERVPGPTYAQPVRDQSRSGVRMPSSAIPWCRVRAVSPTRKSRFSTTSGALSGLSTWHWS